MLVGNAKRMAVILRSVATKDLTDERKTDPSLSLRMTENRIGGKSMRKVSSYSWAK
jgi:hypothetical protein